MSTARRYQRLLTAVERDERYATINAYWRDPAPFEAERREEQAKLNAQIDAAVRRANPHPWEREREQQADFIPPRSHLAWSAQ